MKADKDREPVEEGWCATCRHDWRGHACPGPYFVDGKLICWIAPIEADAPTDNPPKEPTP